MNVIIGHHPKNEKLVVSVGGNKHFSLDASMGEKATLAGGLEALRGFFISVRAATARVLLNVQVKYQACYQEGPLATVIREYQHANPRSLYHLEGFLKGMRVRTTHIVRKTSSGRVRSASVKTITWLATPVDGRSCTNPPRVVRHGAGPFEVQFFMESKNAHGAPVVLATAPAEGKAKRAKKAVKAGPVTPGQDISVGEYFKREYNMVLDPKLPVVNVEPRNDATCCDRKFRTIE